MQFKLGMEALCSACDIYLRYTLALTGNSTDESHEKYIKDVSIQYVAKCAMETACRWLNFSIVLSDIIIIDLHMYFSKLYDV